MDGETFGAFAGLLVIAAVVVYGVGSQAYLLVGSGDNYVVTVNDKWIKSQGDNEQKYLFSDTNGNVYSLEDSYWQWTFDSSDRFASIEKNHTYEIDTFGRRSRWFSNYPNAYDIREVD